MKITKRGIPPKERILTATCKKCSSEYEFALSDKEVKYSPPHPQDIYDTSHYYFSCQVCDNTIYIHPHRDM